MNYQPSPVAPNLPQAEDKLINNAEAANYLGVSPGTLDVWRCTKRYRIPFIKVGRLVKYRKSSLDEFIASRTMEG